MMRSLNTQDIIGAQPKKIANNRFRNNGNTSSINLAIGEQIMNGTSLPCSPPKDRMNFLQPQLPNSYNKPKAVYHQVDQVKSIFQNDENELVMKDIKKVNLSISPFNNKISNNININGGAQSTTSLNNNSMNISQILKQNGDNYRKESVENLKKSLPTVNESAPRMKSDNDYNMQREKKKDIEIKINEQLPSADNYLRQSSSNNNNNNNSSNINYNYNNNYNNNNNNNNNNANINSSNSYSPNQVQAYQDQGRRYSSSKNTMQAQNDKYSQPLTLSIKYPVQQGVINLFDIKKVEEEKPLSKSLIQSTKGNNNNTNNNQQMISSGEQRQSLIVNNGRTSEKNLNYSQSQQQAGNVFASNQGISGKESIVFQTKPVEQIQIKSSPEFYQMKGIPVKNNVVPIHHMFNSYHPNNLDQKGFQIQMQLVQSSQMDVSSNAQIPEDEQDEKSPGGGFYGETSPLSPQPVQMPVFDMKLLSDGKQSQKDLLQNKKAYSQSRKLQTPISQYNKNKMEGVKKESKKYQQPWSQLAREQRIIVVCESSNQTREWINRFLSMRNITEYESFTLPGGPEDQEERKYWQIAFKQFVTNLSRIYQIQEIQIYQNSNSVYPNIFQQEATTGRGTQHMTLQDNLKQGCSFVKENIQLPVKGFNINSKGIIEKAI